MSLSKFLLLLALAARELLPGPQSGRQDPQPPGRQQAGRHKEGCKQPLIAASDIIQIRLEWGPWQGGPIWPLPARALLPAPPNGRLIAAIDLNLNSSPLIPIRMAAGSLFAFVSFPQNWPICLPHFYDDQDDQDQDQDDDGGAG